MAASAMATFSNTSRYAFWESVKWRCSAKLRAESFHSELAEVEFQNRANKVWSAVRVTLVALPMVFTSFRSAAYRGLVRRGGPPGRNCAGAAITHGVI